MLVAGLNQIPLEKFDRVIVTITRQQAETFDAEIVLQQAFEGVNNFDLCILSNWTNGPYETINETIDKSQVTGAVVIKDADNFVSFDLHNLTSGTNFIVGCSLSQCHVAQPQNKSFIKVNDQGFVSDIVEKSIQSNMICVGIYGFSDAQEFQRSGRDLMEEQAPSPGEVFVSHVIARMIQKNSTAFRYISAISFEDWGTAVEWSQVQSNHKTIFIDLDGVLLKNRGRLGVLNWQNSMELIGENVSRLKELFDLGAQIVITTARPEQYSMFIRELLLEHGIDVYAVVTGLNHAPRLIVNDFAPTNPFPSCSAISVPRDSSIRAYV